MRFKMLGPVEMVDRGKPVALGGAKQRATLAYLLIYPNRVVATSRLIQALWTDHDTPKSARKILQNAIWSLRGRLSFGRSDEADVALQTQAPGYVLRVDPDEIDMHRFLRLAKEGRTELAGGSPRAAARLLREALALWHGPALADLVEAGTSWPEVTALQNARLDAMEDYFDAEMACGGHHEILDELELLVKNEPMRERACGQLMLALYRSGRQADALRVYSRIRSTLVGGLGLEPGKALQELQCAILNQDPELAPPFPQQRTRLIEPADSQPRQQPAVDHPGERTTAMPATGEVGVVMIRTRLTARFGGDGVVLDDERLEQAADTTRVKVEQFGGTLTASIGSVSLALFDRPGATGNAVRAVQAAMAIRNALLAFPQRARQTLIFHAAVATGTVAPRVRRIDAGERAAPVDRATLAKCESLLPHVPDGEILVCDLTRDLSSSSVTYRQATNDSFAVWQVLWPSPPDADGPDPYGDRSCELDLLQGLLTWVRNHATPHLVTVVGGPNSGKSCLLADFERLLAGIEDASRLVVDRISAATDDCAAAAQRRLLRLLCGIQHAEPTPTASAKLAATIGRIAASEDESNWLTADLFPLLDIDTTPQRAWPNTMPAWRRFLDRIALTDPLVVLVDDLHHEDDALVDLLHDLTHCRRPLQLLLVATTRPGLHTRHPEWGMATHDATKITLGTRSSADARGVPDGLDVADRRGGTPLDWLRPLTISTL